MRTFATPDQMSEEPGFESIGTGILTRFEVAGGSVIGQFHRDIGKNNQDALQVIWMDETLIAVVCDGCSSGMHSEVGATLGAKLVAESLAQSLLRDGQPDWRWVHESVLGEIEALISAMGIEPIQALLDHFLFTIIGVVITPQGATVFTLGDGVFSINGEITIIGPFPDNAPPYLAYELVQPELMGQQMQIYPTIPLQKLESVLIGTDGVMDLLEAEERCLPGRSELVGPLSQFWQQDRFFENPEAVHRRLNVINREMVRADWESQRLIREKGLLPDDTTLIVIRQHLL